MNEKSVGKMILLVILGVSTLFVPTMAVRFGGVLGWVLIIGSGLLSGGYSALIMWIIRHNKGDDYSEAGIPFGKTLNVVISIWFGIKYIILASLLIAVSGKIVKVELLGEAKYIWIVATLSLIGLYGGSKGDKGIIRLSEFIFYIFIIPILLLLIFSIKGTDLAEVFAGQTSDVSITKIITGIVLITFIFSPWEMLLFMPEVKNRINKKKIYLITAGITAINLLFFVLSVGKLSVPIISEKENGTLMLMKNIMVGNAIMNKQAGIYLSFYILFVMLSICLLFTMTFILMDRVKVGLGKYTHILCGFLIFFIAVGIAQNNKSISGEVEGVVKRTDIEERRYVDTIFADYKNSKYYILLTFAGERNSPMYFKLSNLSDMETEFGKQSTGQLDYSNLQAIVLKLDMTKNNPAMNIFFDYVNELENIFDNTYVFATMTDITDIRKNYLEEETGQNTNGGLKNPGREMSQIIRNNKGYSGITLSDIKKIKYKKQKEERISLFEFDGSPKLSSEAVVEFN